MSSMPRVLRSPPSSMPSTQTACQAKSGSEPDLAGPQDCVKTPEKNITMRRKPQRRDNSPNKEECWQYSKELNSFKSELMWMLSSWKDENDQRLTTWKAEQDATLSMLVKDVNDLKAQCNQIQKTNTDIEASMEFVSQSYDEMKSRLAQLEREKCENTERIELLEKQIQDLNLKSRSATVELRNIPNKRDEKIEDLLSVLSRVGKVVNRTVDKADLRDIYRLPGKEDSVRPLVVEFISVTKRTEFLTAARLYNKNLPKEEKLNSVTLGLPGDKKPIYVDEHLTPAQKKLLYDTRQWAQLHSYKSWHSNGKVFVKMNPEGKPIHIKSERCLASLAKKQ